ncbi:hypothetical protein E5288_WYG019973 [Bos mutus]|uniref:Uncharacterized protein n=1 Tax=Bos mutus TaxID=72004 RepID=A0A6B0RFX0_9CETA|nr:hypothetical protein [Bos mutus]
MRVSSRVCMDVCVDPGPIPQSNLIKDRRDQYIALHGKDAQKTTEIEIHRSPRNAELGKRHENSSNPKTLSYEVGPKRMMPLRTFIAYGATRTKRILVIAVIGMLVSARLSTAIQATQSRYLGSKSLHMMTAKYSGT